MNAFDTFAMVDWSGGNDTGRKAHKDAIWVAVAHAGIAEDPIYLRNRQVAEDWLSKLIETELNSGRRLCLGFDFPFGYPMGFSAALTGTNAPLRLWAWFADRIEDAPHSNNRFDLAGEINLTLGKGCGPFWANGLKKREIAGLPRTKAGYANPFPERRKVELRAKGSFTCWQMAGKGAVGSQVMMGLPVLYRLRTRFRGNVAVWPFERLDAPIAFVEIWPSLMVGSMPDGWIKDEWQVYSMAHILANLPPDEFARHLAVSAPEEGWILGVPGSLDQ